MKKIFSFFFEKKEKRKIEYATSRSAVPETIMGGLEVSFIDGRPGSEFAKTKGKRLNSALTEP
jgi:hypothetical protein